MSESKLAAARAALREALRETDDRGTRFYIREALQHLVVLESRCEGDGASPAGDDGDAPVLSVDPRDDSAGEIESLEAAEFLSQDLDRN